MSASVVDALAAWSAYEAFSRKSHVEYMTRPSSSCRLDALSHCLCCGIPNAQPDVCLTCQRLDPEWGAVAADHDRVVVIRRADMFGAWT